MPKESAAQVLTQSLTAGGFTGGYLFCIGKEVSSNTTLRETLILESAKDTRRYVPLFDGCGNTSAGVALSSANLGSERLGDVPRRGDLFKYLT